MPALVLSPAPTMSIGPCTGYAAIISTIVEREYVNKAQGRFTPTRLGEKVSELLVKAFEDIFDVGFTARLEDELDEIEEILSHDKAKQRR